VLVMGCLRSILVSTALHSGLDAIVAPAPSLVAVVLLPPPFPLCLDSACVP